MPDPDAYFPPPSATSRLEAPDPPITGPTRYTQSRKIRDFISSVEDMARDPLTVTVDGSKILDGTQKSDVLALLGVSEEVIDEAWRHFATEVNWPITVHEGGVLPTQRQEGMGWQVDVDIVQDRTAGIDGLAAVDPRFANRMVTYRAKRWYHTEADLDAAGLGGLGPPSGWEVRTKTESIEASGALAASWRSVEEDEIDSTENTVAALLAARMELGNARNEIQVAQKVANAAWQGVRSDAAKFKFGLEYEVISAAWDSAEAWRQYLDDLIPEQRDAKEQEDALKRELAVEVVFLAATGVAGRVASLAFSAGKAAKTALAGSKVVSYADKVGRMLGPLRSRYGAVVSKVVQSSAALHTARAVARGAGGLTTTAAINKAGGRSTTTEDWLIAFGVAGFGYGIGEGAGKLLASIKRKHGVKFTDPAIESSKSVADGAAQTAAKARLADDALAGPFAVGLGADAAKASTASRLKKRLGDELRNEPNSIPMQRAQARLDRERKLADPEGKPHGPLDDMRKLHQYINEEIEKTVNRKVDPLLEFAYAGGAQAAEKVPETVNPPGRLPAEKVHETVFAPGGPRAPSGTVAQPIRN